MIPGTDNNTKKGHFDLPGRIITALGLSLGLLGVIYLATHPEPLPVWVLEGTIVAAPTACLAYGGHWITKRPSDRMDRWLAVAWTLGGAVITSAFVIGYVLSEQFGGAAVAEVGQLVLFGALGGALVGFLAVISTQFQSHIGNSVGFNRVFGFTVVKPQTVRRIGRTLLRGWVSGIVGLMTGVLFGRNVWITYLKRFKTTDGLVPFETHGVTLFLDPTDRGISRDLLTYGAREEVATKVIRQELNSLRSAVDGPITALDIGANRGYYAFQFADILGDYGTVFAVEPEPSNLVSLHRGIEANGFGNMTVDESAIGVEDGVQELQISTHSNSHTLDSDIPDSKKDDYRSSIEIPVWSISSFLANHGIEPGEVDFVKVDVEGFETAVVESMAPIFDSGGPGLLFVELHPHRVDIADLHDIVDRIETNGFEIVKASSSAASDLPTYHEIRAHLASDEGSHTVELIARKPSKVTLSTTDGPRA